MDLTTILYVLAGVTTFFFVIRLVLLFIGVDGHGDMPSELSDAASAADFKIFTLLTGIVTVMVGSWLSLLMLSMGISTPVALGGSYTAGFLAAIAVGYAVFSLRKLEHDGTIRNFQAEGLKGTCYVKIPEAGKGKGQVQISVQGRLRTFDAVSDGPEIESFKPVVVMARVDDKTLRVCQTD
jgi:membrane protein implicated in regulation of membrane protease activity